MGIKFYFSTHFLKTQKMNTVLRINEEEGAILVEGFGQEAINSIRKHYQKTERRKSFVKIVLLGFMDNKGKFIPYKNS